MMSISDELKERNILKLILIVRFVCAPLHVEHFIFVYVKTLSRPEVCHRFTTRIFPSLNTSAISARLHQSAQSICFIGTL
jgi:hypothetical protein